VKKRKRSTANLVTRDNPTEPCPNCGRRVARSRLLAHFKHPECLVEETRAHMRERGYTIAGVWANLSQVAQGYPPGFNHGECGIVRAPGRLEGFPAKAVMSLWAPLAAVRAAQFVGRIRMSYAKRGKLSQMLFTRPELYEPLDAALRLGGRLAVQNVALALLVED
jgi:hypothetical protein